MRTIGKVQCLQPLKQSHLLSYSLGVINTVLKIDAGMSLKDSQLVFPFAKIESNEIEMCNTVDLDPTTDLCPVVQWINTLHF